MGTAKALTKAMDRAAAEVHDADYGRQRCEEAIELAHRAAKTYMELAERLYEIMTKKLYRDYSGKDGNSYSSFERFVEHELDMAARKAFYLLDIHKKFIVDLKMPKSKLEETSFSKVREFAGVVDDVKDAELWIEKAKGMDYADVRDAASAEKRKVKVTDKGDVMHKFHALLSDDAYKNVMEALDHAAGEVDKEVEGRRGYLLDLICTAYLANEALTLEPDDDRLRRVMDGLERVYKVDIIVGQNGKIICGSKRAAKKLGE